MGVSGRGGDCCTGPPARHHGLTFCSRARTRPTLLPHLPSGGLFQLPGLIIMSLVGVGVAEFLKAPAPWLRGATAGLGAAGVALIAASAAALTRGCCKDRTTLLLAALSAIVTFYYVAIWVFPALILFGGLVTLVANRKKDMSITATDQHLERFGLPRWAAAATAASWLAILIATLVAARFLPAPPFQWWATFYRPGP